MSDYRHLANPHIRLATCESQERDEEINLNSARSALRRVEGNPTLSDDERAAHVGNYERAIESHEHNLSVLREEETELREEIAAGDWGDPVVLRRATERVAEAALPKSRRHTERCEAVMAAEDVPCVCGTDELASALDDLHVALQKP